MCTLGRVLTLGFVAIVLAVCTAFAAGSEQSIFLAPPELVVVVGSDAPWVEQHAAEEFVRYVELLTGSPPVVATCDDPIALGSPRAVILGSPGTNALVRQLAAEGLVDYSPIALDGFVIKSVERDGKKWLVMGGLTGTGTLYAVYEYLQRYCHFGFFLDGDRIPEQGDVILDGISYQSNPRFTYRKHIRFGNGHLLLRQYTCHWWKWRDFKFNIDWWAKRGLNEGDVCLAFSGAGGILKDETVKEIFQGALKPEDWAEGGCRANDEWPAEYRLDIERKGYEYSDKLGFYTEPYPIAWIPPWFKEKHPELDYNSNLLRQKFVRAYLQRLMREFPVRHHIYGGLDRLWYSETPGYVGEWIYNMLSLRDETIKNREMLHTLDPLGMERQDWGWWVKWGQQWVAPWHLQWRCYWSKEILKQYMESFPGGFVYLDDYTTDQYTTSSFQAYDYYWGAPTSMGTFWNTAMETLHGDYAFTLNKVKNVAQDPKAHNIIGFRLHQESQGSNPMYRQFLTALAWNPAGVDLDEFLSNYALQRYGAASHETMNACLRKIVEATKLNTIRDQYGWGGGYIPFYRFSLRPYSTKYRLMDDNVECFRLMHEALALALKEKDGQADNPLYGRDIVDMARVALGKLFDIHFVKAELALALGDAKKAKAHEEECYRIMDVIQSVLTTRDDFSMAETIRYASSVPGAKAPKGFESIAHYCRAGSGTYGNSDNPEQMYYQYKPTVKAHFARLRGEKAPSNQEIFNEYVKGPYELPEKLTFKGTTIEAVGEAMEYMAAQKTVALSSEAKATWEELTQLWGPYAQKESVEIPSSEGAIVSDDFTSGTIDSSKWEGTHAMFIGDVAALHGKLSHTFEADDWAVEFRANMLSLEYAYPQVNVTKPFGRRWAAITCQNVENPGVDPLKGNVAFHTETEEGGRTYRRENLMKADGQFHVYKIEKVGEEVTAYVDGERKAALRIENGTDKKWILEFGGYEEMPLFLDWIVLTGSTK